MVSHRIKIAVVVQQLVMAGDAKRADDHVDGLAHCNSTRPQSAVVARSLNSQATIKHGRDWKTPQAPLDPVSMRLVTRTL